MSGPGYQGERMVLAALGLIGLALASSMTFVILFPVRPRAPPGVAVTMPSGVSLDTTLNFRPGFVTIHVGNAVQWVNKDDSPHTTTASSVPSGTVKWDSGELDLGDSFGLVLTVAGNYTYHCTFHPGWMRGTIIVTSS